MLRIADLSSRDAPSSLSVLAAVCSHDFVIGESVFSRFEHRWKVPEEQQASTSCIQIFLLRSTNQDARIHMPLRPRLYTEAFVLEESAVHPSMAP